MSLKWLDFTVLTLVVQLYSATFGFATFCCEVVCGMCGVCGAHMFGVQRLIFRNCPPFFFFLIFCHWLARLAGQWASWILLFLLLRLQTHATMPCFFCGFWWSNSSLYIYGNRFTEFLSPLPYYCLCIASISSILSFPFFPFSVA